MKFVRIAEADPYQHPPPFLLQKAYPYKHFRLWWSRQEEEEEEEEEEGNSTVA